MKLIEIEQRTLFDLVQETHQLLREKEALEGQYIDVVVRIGQNLIDIRPHKSYGEFIPFVTEEFNISRVTANDYIHVAEIYGDNVRRVLHLPLRVVYELASPSMPEQVREQVESGQIEPTLPAIREAKRDYQPPEPIQPSVYTPPPMPVHWAPPLQLVEMPEEMKLSPVMRIETPVETSVKSSALTALQSSDSNEWYTPAEYVNAARKLMGGIDVDPASCERANQIVQAKMFYSKNGLNQSWAGRVWLNPPYGFENGKSNQELWSHQLTERYKAGLVTEAVLLVNANTEAKWFQPLYDYLICFTDHRIRFYNDDGESSQPTQGNAFIYFGKQEQRFVELFRPFGRILKEIKL